jgi:DnaJ-class molecular chaperone
VTDNPYDILGVRPGDSDEVIRKAYRKAAKRHHPDLNPDKPDALARFKQLNAANEILSDPAKRARYDRGEIDGSGNDIPPERPSYREAAGGDFGGAPAGGAQYGGTQYGGTQYGGTQYGGTQYGGAHGLSPDDLAALFGGAFGERFGEAGLRAHGQDAHYNLTVDFLDAANGAVRRLTLPGGRTLDVTIPAGLRDGHVLRLKGQGGPGHGDAPAGDALVGISVAPHRFFRRDGNDVLLELPVTLQEAVRGATIDVPTVAGPVRLTIPPNSANGAKLRLARRGIAGGNQIVELRLVLPPSPEPDLAAFLDTWHPAHPFNPRASLEQSP